jgi:hypothetical protein
MSISATRAVDRDLDFSSNGALDQQLARRNRVQ